MVEQRSPLGAAYRPGRHGRVNDTVGATLSERQPGSIVQLAAWSGQEDAMRALIKDISGLELPATSGGGIAEPAKAAFGIAPGKVLLIDDTDGIFADYSAALPENIGVVTDLSHGRSVIRIVGPNAEWVLSKLFAIDFTSGAFPVGAGRSTTHHDIFTQIQRSGEDQFDLYVFRSFARSFWQTLCHAAGEVGYEVI